MRTYITLDFHCHICRYVGHVLRNVHVSGNLSIWLDDVQCTGCEKSLENCPHQPWGSHNCSHHNDVSIACYDRKSLPAIFYPFGNDEGDSIVVTKDRNYGYDSDMSCNASSINIPYDIFNNGSLYVSSVCVNFHKIDEVRFA